MGQKCFFRQFIHSVAKVDYLTLRHGFISVMSFQVPTFSNFMNNYTHKNKNNIGPKCFCHLHKVYIVQKKFRLTYQAGLTASISKTIYSDPWKKISKPWSESGC